MPLDKTEVVCMYREIWLNNAEFKIRFVFLISITIISFKKEFIIPNWKSFRKRI